MEFAYDLVPGDPSGVGAGISRIDPRGADLLVGSDRLGSEALSMFAPPWVTPNQYSKYVRQFEPLPGTDLAVDWMIRDWPRRGHTTWRQEFLSGREVSGSNQSADVSISCSYADFAGFLMGVVFLEEMAASRIESGGIAGVSCLSGLTHHHDALRISTIPGKMRVLVHAVCVQVSQC